MRISTTDILRAIVSQMTFNFIATSIVDNLNLTYTLSTVNTYHLQPGKNIIIDTVDYKIESMVFNESITIKTVDGSDTLPVVAVFPLYTPFFKHGRVADVNGEMQIEADSNNKLPMIYLIKPYDDDYLGRDSRLDRNASVRLFFMAEADFSSTWLIEDHENNAIKPMNNLVEMFLFTLRNIKKIDRFSIADWKIRDHMKFGVIQSDVKKEKAYFNDNMSGCELQITIPILRFSSCDEFTLNPSCLPGRIVDGDGNLIQLLYSNEEYVDDGGGDLTVTNSDDSYTQTGSSPLELPDTEFNIYVNGVLDQTFSVPTLKDEVINISP